MVELGDLTKLLDQGHLSEEYAYSSDQGEYRFRLKTLTPLQDLEARRAAKKTSLADGVSEEDTNSYSVYEAVELLSRAVQEINNVKLEEVPAAQGSSLLEKRRSIISKLSEQLLLDLWKKYNDMRVKSTLSGTEEEDEAVKK